MQYPNKNLMDTPIKTTIFLIRHGQTEWNEQGLILGQSESFLTEAGKKQARELYEQFRDINFDKIFSSDLERAIETAKAIAVDRKIEVHTSKLLREKKMGDYEGKHVDVLKVDNKKLHDDYGKLSDDQKWKYKRAENMESLAEACNRLLTFLRRIVADYSGKTVLLVSHESILQSLLIYLRWGTQREVRGGHIENGGYIKLHSDGKYFFVDEVRGVFKK